MANRCAAVFVFGGVACRRRAHRSGAHKGVTTVSDGSVVAISWRWDSPRVLEVVKLTGLPGGGTGGASSL